MKSVGGLSKKSHRLSSIYQKNLAAAAISILDTTVLGGRVVGWVDQQERKLTSGKIEIEIELEFSKDIACKILLFWQILRMHLC